MIVIDVRFVRSGVWYVYSALMPSLKLGEQRAALSRAGGRVVHLPPADGRRFSFVHVQEIKATYGNSNNLFL